MYGSYGKITTTRGNIHVYLGMTFDFSDEGKVKIDLEAQIRHIGSHIDPSRYDSVGRTGRTDSTGGK
jgi:hypothetical protein